VTVFSTKGGVGKTVLATNLALALARDKSRSVALVDLDLEWGDVAIMMGMKPVHTIYDAVQVFDRLDSEMLCGFMERHSGGASVLLAPVHPEDAEGINAARVAQVLDLLRANFDYVVVDTAPSLSEVVLTALDRSDEIYVVTMMDVASVKNTRISLQKLTQLGYDPARVRIILNRADSKVLLQPSEVEEAIGGTVVARIPSDRIVPLSVNKGVPVVVDAPKSAVARCIDALADSAARREA
jgi:pilus assembly protein CpaE